MNCQSVKIQSVFLFLLAINFLFPTFNSILSRTGTVGVLIINSFVLFSIIILLVYFFKRYLHRLSVPEVVFLSVCCLYFINILITGILNYKVQLSDLFELFRPVFYLALFMLGYNMIRLGLLNVNKAISLFSFFILLTAIFSLINIIFFEQFGRLVMSFYVKDTLLPSRRFTGTFQNPYDFAFIGVLPLAYYLFRFLSKGSFKYIIAVGVILTTALFGQSKAGFITMLIVLTQVLLFYPLCAHPNKTLSNKSVLIRFLSLPFIFIMVAIYVYIEFGDKFSYLINGIIALSSGGDRSSNIRLEQIFLAYDMLSSDIVNLIFGFGSYKHSGLMFESLYPLYFFRYGMFAILFFAFWIILPLILVTFFKSKALSNPSRLILFTFFFAVLPSGMGNNIIDQNRIPFIYFFLIGSVYCAYFNKCNLNEKNSAI